MFSLVFVLCCVHVFVLFTCIDDMQCVCLCMFFRDLISVRGVCCVCLLFCILFVVCVNVFFFLDELFCVVRTCCVVICVLCVLFAVDYVCVCCVLFVLSVLWLCACVRVFVDACLNWCWELCCV